MPRTRSLFGLPFGAWVAGALVLALLLSLAGAYGFHGDEMYFILCGRHPDFGYVDQPPFTPLLSVISTDLLGTSPFAVRIAPALVAAFVILLCADMARRLGVSSRGQVLAAIMLGGSVWTAAGHLDTTSTYDIFFWSLALWLLIQLLSVEQPAAEGPAAEGPATERAAAARPAVEWRRWIALGLVMGVGLENKTLVIFLAASLAAGVLLARRWDIVRSPGLWVAIAIALAIWAPNVVWQVQHGFTQIQMAQSISSGNSSLGDRIGAILDVIILPQLFLFPVTIAGVVWLVRGRASEPWRALGLAFLVDLALMFVSAGKDYYALGFFPLLVAAGAGPLDRWLRRSWVRWSVFVPVGVCSAALLAYATLPIIPADQLANTSVPSIDTVEIEELGWPQMASQVEAVAVALPAAERAHAAVIAASYSQYGALEIYGRNLPPVYSGHNSTWYWGRPADGTTTVILVTWVLVYSDSPSTYFSSCRTAAIIDNGYNLPTQDQGGAITVCSSAGVDWTALWPKLKIVE